jgi:hypothetical protein
MSRLLFQDQLDHGRDTGIREMGVALFAATFVLRSSSDWVYCPHRTLLPGKTRAFVELVVQQSGQDRLMERLDGRSL